jgi:hypothetical protein
MPLGRVAAVTASLALVGAVIGGVVGGGLLLVRSLVLGLAQSDVVGLSLAGTAFSALLGAVLAPATAWMFLRRVALGRAIAQTTIGTTVGAALGMVIEAVILKRPTVLFGVIGALVGFFAAAVRLRIITRSSSVEPRASANGA